MRKTITITMPPEAQRDAGKVFIITEMSARQAEEWAWRAFLALGKNRTDIPANLRELGMMGFAAVGIGALASIGFHDAKPLLDEMMACVKIMPDASKPMVVRALIDDDTEEVNTILRLRDEVFNLHVGFSVAGFLSKAWNEPTKPEPARAKR